MNENGDEVLIGVVNKVTGNCKDAAATTASVATSVTRTSAFAAWIQKMIDDPPEAAAPAACGALTLDPNLYDTSDCTEGSFVGSQPCTVKCKYLSSLHVFKEICLLGHKSCSKSELRVVVVAQRCTIAVSARESAHFAHPHIHTQIHTLKHPPTHPHNCNDKNTNTRRCAPNYCRNNAAITSEYACTGSGTASWTGTLPASCPAAPNTGTCAALSVTTQYTSTCGANGAIDNTCSVTCTYVTF